MKIIVTNPNAARVLDASNGAAVWKEIQAAERQTACGGGRSVSR
ncbi:hypothetical protein [Lysobacter arvi]|uniref:Uncharacterized protein n=1 Tax=Lysobacter arvi TaxID=3038776 RepID=A0ABU1CDQ4_9GAMM|nr:hypothetical protein [Lysobacter arvi]MDR0183323.1 hypothetical protein [Lysobacter arvi]